MKLDPAIPRDLATIVHKAIARDPSDRYATAGDLAADLTRFLEDRPIRARRLSPFGVAWRWARRNKPVASLLAARRRPGSGPLDRRDDRRRSIPCGRPEGAARSPTGRRRAKQAQAATRARNESDANAARANAARAEADQSAAESKAVVAFVTDDVLGAAAPSKTLGQAVTVQQALAKADRALAGEVRQGASGRGIGPRGLGAGLH